MSVALLLRTALRVFLPGYCEEVIELVALRQKFFWAATSMVVEKQWCILVLSARNWNN